MTFAFTHYLHNVDLALIFILSYISSAKKHLKCNLPYSSDWKCWGGGTTKQKEKASQQKDFLKKST